MRPDEDYSLEGWRENICQRCGGNGWLDGREERAVRRVHAGRLNPQAVFNMPERTLHSGGVEYLSVAEYDAIACDECSGEGYVWEHSDDRVWDVAGWGGVDNLWDRDVALEWATDGTASAIVATGLRPENVRLRLNAVRRYWLWNPPGKRPRRYVPLAERPNPQLGPEPNDGRTRAERFRESLAGHPKPVLLLRMRERANGANVTKTHVVPNPDVCPEGFFFGCHHTQSPKLTEISVEEFLGYDWSALCPRCLNALTQTDSEFALEVMRACMNMGLPRPALHSARAAEKLAATLGWPDDWIERLETCRRWEARWSDARAESEPMTDREIVEWIRNLGERLGRTPTTNDFNEAEGGRCSSEIIRRLGSIRTAQIMAGFKPVKNPQAPEAIRITPEQLQALVHVRDYGTFNGTPHRTKHTLYRRRFVVPPVDNDGRNWALTEKGQSAVAYYED